MPLELEADDQAGTDRLWKDVRSWPVVRNELLPTGVDHRWPAGVGWMPAVAPGGQRVGGN